MTDAFDLFWEWANKPIDSRLMLDGRIYNPIMALPEHQRRDRAKVNEAVARYVWPEKEVRSSGRANKTSKPQAGV